MSSEGCSLARSMSRSESRVEREGSGQLRFKPPLRLLSKSDLDGGNSKVLEDVLPSKLSWNSAGAAATAGVLPAMDRDDEGETQCESSSISSSSGALADDWTPRSVSPLMERINSIHPVWGRQATLPDSLQVAGWTVHGGMQVLYDIRGILGNSKVRKATASNPRRCDGRVEDVAVKSVALSDCPTSLAMMRRECSILLELGDEHRHVLSMLGCAIFETELVLLTRLAPDGDLAAYIRVGFCLEEVQARRLNLQLMSALSYLRERHITHGDVKPQNIMLTRVKDAFVVELGDFGLAVRVPPGREFVTIAGVQGSYGFIPREVRSLLQLGYAADLFALGVMTFLALASYVPFHPASAVEAALEFDPVCWSPLSAAAKAYAVQLLDVCPVRRGTASELLTGHEWLCAQESLLVGEERCGYAPLPLESARFHTLEDSAKLGSSRRKA